MDSHQLRQIAISIAKEFPDLQPIEPLKVVGEGFRSIAVETSGGILVRVGKSSEARIGFDLESLALPFIRDHVSAPIPEPRWHSSSSSSFEYGAFGYRKLSGEEPLPDDPTLKQSFIPELAKFLVQLHSAPVDQALLVGIPRVDSVKRIIGARSVVMPELKTRLTSQEFALLDRWWDELEGDKNMFTDRIAVCHHDLWHGNLLVDPIGHLAGVLDWSHCEVGDPANDFAAIYHFGDELAQLFIDEYKNQGGSVSVDDMHRISKFWQSRELGRIAWAIENDDQEEVSEGVHRLRRGTIFT